MKSFIDNFSGAFSNGTKGIRRWYAYRILRSKVKKDLYELNRAIDRGEEDCKTAFQIIKIQARNAGSKIDFAPMSGEFYITNNDQYIILTSKSARIINGVYHYDVRMPQEVTHYLDKYLKRIVERRRLTVKQHIESKIDRSLKDILNRFSNG